MTDRLGAKAVKGSMWLSVSSLATKLLGALRLLILAALLPQSELGLFGISIIVMRFAEQLLQTGIRQALIQRDGKIESYLGTAWTAQIVRGLFFSLLLWVSAENIEKFFDKEGIAELLRWLAILPALQGFSNVGFVHLHRELAFNKVVLHTTIVSMTDILFSVLFAWYWPVALSLVFGKLLSTFISILLSFGIERRRASLEFSSSQFKELYKFGFWIFLSSILSFTMVSGGDLVIGKVLPTESLAVYQVAYSLACMPLMAITAVIATTMYSAFSRIQNDQLRLVSVFLRVFALACTLSAASVAGFAAIGPLFTSVFLKPSYAMVAALLPILSVWGASRALGSINSVLFQAIGRPALATVFQVVMVIMFGVLLLPLTTYFGLLGLAWGLVGIGTISHAGRCLMLSRILEIKPLDLVNRIAFPSLVGLVAFGGCRLVLHLLDGSDDWIQLFAGTTVLLLIYVAGTLTLESLFDFGILSFLSSHVPILDRTINKFSRGTAKQSS